MGSVVACVTVGPVTVDLGVAVGPIVDVSRVVTALVVLGDPAENGPEHALQPVCPPTSPIESPALPPHVPGAWLARHSGPSKRGVFLSQLTLMSCGNQP